MMRTQVPRTYLTGTVILEPNRRGQRAQVRAEPRQRPNASSFDAGTNPGSKGPLRYVHY